MFLHAVLTAGIISLRVHRNSPRYFFLNDQTPCHSILLSHVVESLDSLDICYTTRTLSSRVFSSSQENISLSLPSCSQPFHLFRSHLCHTHSALDSCFIFFIPSFSFIFDPFSSSGHWSFRLSPCTLLSFFVQNSSSSHLSLAWPFLSVSCLCASFVKKYQKVVTSVISLSTHVWLVSFLFSLSTSLSALQIIRSGRLPGYTKPLPARWDS